MESPVHIQYVQQYTRILAETYAKIFPRARMTAKKIDMIVDAAGLHDIGKLAISDAVLSRTGKLSEAEMEIMKEHTVKGYQIVKVLTEYEPEDYRRICCNVCLYHHEKYDGTGYPNKVKKDRIPLEAQLVGLADMYDALIHSTVNRQVCSNEQAYYMLVNGQCGRLSPRIRECLEAGRDALEAYTVDDFAQAGEERSDNELE
ncbi:MAG: HD domain-containing protein [Lachnospiraceae bacterium]|nr:HD domain-containing protein [Lachnospiraceae bacterium]